MAKKVFLGVGHGGSDPGAVANGLKEKDVNLNMALACEEVLKAHGVSVKMSRTKDENDALTEEIKECNAFKPDAAVDMHTNAGKGDGAEAFYQIGNSDSKALANDILNEVKLIGQNSRGVKTKKNSSGKDYFGFLRQCKCTSVIFESAFIDSADHKIIDTVAEQKAMGVAVAKGILKYLGITYSEAAMTKKKTVTQLANEVIAGKWGNGITRKNRLTRAGYDYAKVQAKVDEILAKPKKKSIDAIAKEVLLGKWGNGTARKNNLTKAGYDYKAVQAKVNELCK